jgi:aspartate/methionine/tyrosine aminotransferase
VLGSVGSYMDGGANHPLQKAALPFLHPDFVIADALALQAHFRKKRDFLIEQLTALGISVRKPEATFYIWADTSKLPAPINNGVIFFEYCIRFKVICVPVSGLGGAAWEDPAVNSLGAQRCPARRGIRRPPDRLTMCPARAFP